MKYYKFRKDSDENWEWDAMYQIEEEKKLGLIPKFKNKVFLDISEPINMLLVNGQSVKKERKEIPYKTDIIYWGDDITYGAFKPQMGCYMIVSSKLKDFFKKLNLSEHKFYPIHLTNEVDKSTNDSYWVFHTLIDYRDYINYELSTIEFETMEDETWIQKGGFKDKVDFYIKKENDKKYKDTLFYFKEMVMKEIPYDIIGGVGNVLRISEKAKGLIENSDLFGVGVYRYDQSDVMISEKAYWERENEKLS